MNKLPNIAVTEQSWAMGNFWDNVVIEQRAFPHIPQPVVMLPVLMMPNFKEESYISRVWQRMKNDKGNFQWKKEEPPEKPFRMQVTVDDVIVLEGMIDPGRYLKW
jgi:hypothetical protein